MKRHLTWLIAIVALAFPVGAAGGGWATVGLSSTPDGIAPGQPWNVELELLQHGRTPLDGVRPQVTIRERRGRITRTFAARATGRPGIYRASVVFPRAGGWDYVVDDNFSRQHSYPPVRISGVAPAATASASRNDGPPWTAFAAALVAGLAAVGLTFLIQGRRAKRALA